MNDPDEYQACLIVLDGIQEPLLTYITPTEAGYLKASLELCHDGKPGREKNYVLEHKRLRDSLGISQMWLNLERVLAVAFIGEDP